MADCQWAKKALWMKKVQKACKKRISAKDFHRTFIRCLERRGNNAIFTRVKTYIRPTECPHCHNRLDPQEVACPHCHTPNPDEQARHLFKDFLPLSSFKQIGLFACSLIGLSIFSEIVALILVAIAKGQNPTWTAEQLNEYLSSGTVNFLYMLIAYLLVLVAMGLVLFKDCQAWLRRFLKWKNALIGVAFAIGLFVVGILYSLFVISPVYAALGIEGTVNNANQSVLNSMIASVPVGAFFLLSIIGPVTEELGYRAGLFSFLSRFGKPAAYLISILIFAFIHFDFGCFKEGGTAIAIEMVNLPSYLFGGIALSICYDKFGIEGSTTAHILYNAASFFTQLI